LEEAVLEAAADPTRAGRPALPLQRGRRSPRRAGPAIK